jgi:hypothetical protein
MSWLDFHGWMAGKLDEHPQGLKPLRLIEFFGAAEAAPFQNLFMRLDFGLKP